MGPTRRLSARGGGGSRLRALYVLVFGLALALLLAACPADEPDAAPDDDPDVEDTEPEDEPESLGTVRIVSFNTGLGQVFSEAMERNGFDTANGFEGEFLRVDPGAATEVFLQGEAEVTVQLDMLVANIARTQGRDVTVFYPDFTNNGTITVREDSDIESPEDLVGRNVGHFGLESGTTTMFRVLLGRDYGITLTDDFELIQAGAPALVELLDAGEIDAMMNFTPFTERGMAEADGRVLLRADDPAHGFVPGFAAVAAMESWIRDNPELALAVRDAVDDTIRFFTDSDYEVFREEPYADLLGVDDEVLDVVISRAQEAPLMTNEWDEGIVEEARAFLEDVAEQGIVFDEVPEPNVVATLEELLD
jgi:NitT/TauT family transport system substrate-binding protein